MEESYTGLPTSHLLGSVPAVIAEEKNTTNHEVPAANMQIFPPNNGGDRGRGYQTLGSPTEAFEQQPANNWRGIFSISSYTQYFNVDTDLVLNRLINAMNPVAGDFFSKIDANPDLLCLENSLIGSSTVTIIWEILADLYGLIWISTTLVFVLSSLGNLATYLMEKQTDKSTSWSFDVSYVNAAACSIYGYAVVVPLAYYFLLQYMGSNSNLIRFWCMWGYSLAIFVPSSFLMLIPAEIVRWLIIILVGTASASFVALNLKSYIEGSDVSVVIIAAFFLQIALAVFIKVWFFG